MAPAGLKPEFKYVVYIYEFVLVYVGLCVYMSKYLIQCLYINLSLSVYN